ncbi:MAG TPA: hypothetical protein DDZ88_05600 [Verrucomicrobiales bacterium]|nr:hypothetical protein [Verrucomicrobiales bacterium]
MNTLLALSDAELMESADLTDTEFDELENQLAIRAGCLGWTGDPMRQPVDTVAAIVRSIISKRIR